MNLRNTVTRHLMTRRAARTALDRPALVAYPLPRRPHRAARGALLALAVGLVTWGALALAWVVL